MFSICSLQRESTEGRGGGESSSEEKKNRDRQEREVRGRQGGG
jgi:hypothetical protein